MPFYSVQAYGLSGSLDQTMAPMPYATTPEGMPLRHANLCGHSQADRGSGRVTPHGVLGTE